MNNKQIQTFKETAIRNLERDGHLIPIIVLERREDKQLIINALDFNSEMAKHHIFHNIGEQLRTGEYESFLHISEAWVVVREKDKIDKNIRASQEPDRKECIIISYKNDSGEGLMSIIPFIKDVEKVGSKEKIHITILYEEEETNNTNDTNMGGNLWEMWS